MRAVVRRRQPLPYDKTYGNPPTEEAALHDSLACLVQPRMDRTVGANGNLIAVQTLMMFAPKNADLRHEDIIERIIDLRGDVVFEGRRRVVGLLKYATYLEATLEEYR